MRATKPSFSTTSAAATRTTFLFGATFHRGSITDESLVDRLFAEYRFDYVYHLAAYAAEGLSHFIRRYNYQNNVVGTVNLLNAAVNAGTVRRFVFTSSIAVYGAAQNPMTESTAPSPEDPYGVAKYACEMDLRAAGEMFGLEYTVFRPHNVYGEHQNIGDRYRNVIGIFMNQIMQGQPMTIFGDGLQTRAFTHVDDVAPLIFRCVDVPESSNQIFNIGAETPTSVRDLALVVAKALDADPDIRFLDARKEVVHAFSSSDKLQATFGAQNYVPLEEGICRMARSARAKGPRATALFTGIEVWKNLPPSWKGAYHQR